MASPCYQCSPSLPSMPSALCPLLSTLSALADASIPLHCSRSASFHMKVTWCDAAAAPASASSADSVLGWQSDVSSVPLPRPAPPHTLLGSPWTALLLQFCEWNFSPCTRHQWWLRGLLLGWAAVRGHAKTHTQTQRESERERDRKSVCKREREGDWVTMECWTHPANNEQD